ncbi:hypothetical protein IAD21_01374 [Abditibacteriota bacterium]|nr:hypothetical protein IAD21_01374 [Abditibacteriota bacterium]
MLFRFLPPSPQDERAGRFLLVGTVLAIMVIGALLPLPAARGPVSAVLWGALGALAWSLWRAQHSLDQRRKRATNGSIRLARTGLFITDLKPDERVIAFDAIDHLAVGPGKLEIHHKDGVETLATREIENSALLIEELKRRVRLGSGASDFIPLSPM